MLYVKSSKKLPSFHEDTSSVMDEESGKKIESGLRMEEEGIYGEKETVPPGEKKLSCSGKKEAKEYDPPGMLCSSYS